MFSPSFVPNIVASNALHRQIMKGGVGAPPPEDPKPPKKSFWQWLKGFF